ncbi:unnamed protein product [Rotaria magnacalcarata]|uniref:Protein quiver n=1 Tax=Rotaria magnacalcarata TaxID=392030 RepID=A0A816Y9E7_9BILA|nr:unnamed protein product [Rotaria magnacalcarata]
MFLLSSIAIASFLFLIRSQMTEGLHCYACVNCNDPFNSTNVLITPSVSTPPWFCSKKTVHDNTSRSLIQSCAHYGTIGNGQWCCQTDLCNQAKKNLLINSYISDISLLVVEFFFQNIIDL